jgi:hypothetical protein
MYLKKPKQQQQKQRKKRNKENEKIKNYGNTFFLSSSKNY